jgi:hypothetical protein
MFKRIFLLLSLLAALVASARDQPENWLEVRSPHFIVLSDSSEKQARHVADQFERVCLVVRNLISARERGSRNPHRRIGS